MWCKHPIYYTYPPATPTHTLENIQADFLVQANDAKAVDLRHDGDKTRLFKENSANLVLSFAAFKSKEADEAIKTLNHAIATLRKLDIRVVVLAVDEDSHRPKLRMKVADPTIDFLWTGSKAWNSHACKALSVEEADPTAFYFNEMGNCEIVGTIEEVLLGLAGMKSKTARAEQEDQDDDELDQFTPDVVISDSTWESLKMDVETMAKSDLANLTALRRTETTYVDRTASGLVEKAQRKIKQRIVVAGDVFPEGREAFNGFLRKFNENALLGHQGVHFVVRAKPFAFGLTCSKCLLKLQSLHYGCLVDGETFCAKCADQHDDKHPLVVLGSARTNLNSTTFGLGHVVGVHDEVMDANDFHPDIGCDGCALPIGQGVRYKNLSRDDHDLCQRCFQSFCKTIATETESNYNCQASDPFARIKNSRGVGFSRSGGESLLEKAFESPSPPPGHTEFSWVAVRRDDKVGVGHTMFSWGAV